MRRGHKVVTSKEEKTAVAIGKLLSDFHLDLEQVGKYICVALPHTIYARAVEVLESAQYNKEVAEYNELHKEYRQERLF